MSKKLIINADDYGICPSVNYAIENLIGSGKLRSVSILANGAYFREAAFLSNHPECEVGVHSNIVEGVPLAPAGKIGVLLGSDGKFVNLNRILMRYFRAPASVARAVEIEWKAQIEFLLESGLTISHADSHQHIHAFPPFWKILVKLCCEYKIPAVRLPREENKIRLRRVAGFALCQASKVSSAFFTHRSLNVNNHFLGFKRAGIYGENEMIADLKNLKEGVTELCVHPSLDDGVPYPALRGTLEYEALSSPKLWREIAASKIELTTWTELAKTVRSIN